jgi:hypothetical protein
MPRWITQMPGGVREGVVGAILLGAAGCVVGLVIGLGVYPPTAWAAAFEIGLPSAVAGFASGAATGGITYLIRRPPSSK